jgi:Inositol hexakisphosphate
MGAPNFRSPRHGSLNVFGVAQPRINGIKAVLSVLGCKPPALTAVNTPPPINQLNFTVNGRPPTTSYPASSARADSPPRSHCVFFSTREEPVIYISGRPFVLRDASAPKEALSLSDRAENLEGIESRLKEDILIEADKLRVASGSQCFSFQAISSRVGAFGITHFFSSLGLVD